MCVCVYIYIYIYIHMYKPNNTYQTTADSKHLNHNNKHATNVTEEPLIGWHYLSKATCLTLLV